MIYRMHTIFIPLIAVFLAAVPSLSYAVGNLHLGGTELHPAITVSHSYDDNVFLNDDKIDEKVGGSVTVLSPSIELKRVHDERIILLSYGADIYRYYDQPKEDRETHTATAFLDTRFPGGLKLKLRDTFVQTAEAASSETTEKNERMQNLFEVAIASNVFDRLAFELNYGGTIHDYKEDANKTYLEKQDRIENTYGGRFFLKLLPKTSIFLSYKRGEIVYDTVIAGDERDSTSDAYGAGLKGQITSKLNVDIMGGYVERKYKSSANTDFRREIASIAINYDFSPITKFSLQGERKIQESFFVYDEVTLNSSNYFVESRISLNIDYKINYKVSANLGSYYGISEYPKVIDRKDYLSGVDLKLKYDIRPWLSTGVGYAYKQRDSSLDPLLYSDPSSYSKDYQDNRYSINLSAVF